MVLKEKQRGTIKGRRCAEGHKQSLFKANEQTSSPTVNGTLQPALLFGKNNPPTLLSTWASLVDPYNQCIVKKES
jgi:hypothetical protein